MGWGNSAVDYGYQAPIGGITRTETVHVDDSATINLLREHIALLQKQKKELAVSRRAHALVAYTLANSDNRQKRSKKELIELYRRAVSICEEHVRNMGIKRFIDSPPAIVCLEP